MKKLAGKWGQEKLLDTTACFGLHLIRGSAKAPPAPIIFPAPIFLPAVSHSEIAVAKQTRFLDVAVNTQLPSGVGRDIF